MTVIGRDQLFPQRALLKPRKTWTTARDERPFSRGVRRETPYEESHALGSPRDNDHGSPHVRRSVLDNPMSDSAAFHPVGSSTSGADFSGIRISTSVCSSKIHRLPSLNTPFWYTALTGQVPSLRFALRTLRKARRTSAADTEREYAPRRDARRSSRGTNSEGCRERRAYRLGFAHRRRSARQSYVLSFNHTDLGMVRRLVSATLRRHAASAR